MHISKTLGYKPRAKIPGVALLEFKQLIDVTEPGEGPDWANALILGICRLKTKSLTIPIMLHCTNNMFTLMIAILN